jgi:hypothetical protein
METKELNRLKKELKSMEDRLSEIPDEKEGFAQRLKAAQKKDAEADSRIEALRKERQAAIVAGGDVETLTAKMKEIVEYDDLVEDEIAGLTSKLSDLDEEEKKLAVNVKDLGKKIFREETVRPLVDEYNTRAAQLAKTLTEIQRTQRLYAKTFSSSGQALFFSYPNVTGFGVQSLPGMWMRDEQPISEHFNRTVTANELAGEEREEDIKGKYPDCKCFRCDAYTGVDYEGKVRCNRLGGPVPQDILLGQAKQRHAPEAERCMFGPRDI